MSKALQTWLNIIARPQDSEQSLRPANQAIMGSLSKLARTFRVFGHSLVAKGRPYGHVRKSKCYHSPMPEINRSSGGKEK
jgi:hypothetical protein